MVFFGSLIHIADMISPLIDQIEHVEGAEDHESLSHKRRNVWSEDHWLGFLEHKLEHMDWQVWE